MNKPGLMLFLIGFLLTITGLMIYFLLSSQRTPSNAKLVFKYSTVQVNENVGAICNGQKKGDTLGERRKSC